MATETDSPYSSWSILKLLSRNKWKYLLLFTIVFFSALFFLRYRVLNYTSTASVRVIDAVKSEIKPDRNLPDYLLPTDQLSAVFHAVNSAQMEEHLIRKFGLYAHYGIDTTKEFHHGKVLKRLRSAIALKKSPFNTIEITVADRYRYVAYEMANEIALYADTLNRRFILKMQEKRVAFHRKALQQIEEHLMKKQEGLKQLVESIPTTKNAEHTQAMTALNEKIYALSAAVENYNQSLKEEILLLETLSDSNVPTLMIQQRAIPDSQSLLFPSALYAILFVMLSGVILILYHYIRLRFGDHIQLFSSGNHEK